MGEPLLIDSSGLSELPHRLDAYRSCVVDAKTCEALAIADFRARLSFSLQKWRQAGRMGVWLIISTSQARLIPAALGVGFEFHHASSGSTLVLSCWLPRNEPNNLPSGATHFLGVSGLVQRPDGKILVIRESSGPAARAGIWKLPGGLAGKREFIARV
mmetsp:Transcript_34826/g.64476  ORF Transcript_34826/g.64476 Transcript_34826/m.64476 type:complete len:158 (-) Transcript_34826:493-966(-)